jgi:small subunit ribosomal protein S21
MGKEGIVLFRGRIKHYCSPCFKEVIVLAEVHIQDGETLENALRRFKRKVLQEDIIKDVKRHAFYLKPGQKKRVKSALARKRNRKKSNRDSAPEPARQ